MRWLAATNYRCLSSPIKAFLTALTGAGLLAHHAEWWLFAGAVLTTALQVLEIVPACFRFRGSRRPALG